VREEVRKEAARTGARIGLGSTVTLADPDGGGKAVKFTVVERREADPAMGWVSVEAPIARAVLGHEVGDEVVVPTPREESAATGSSAPRGGCRVASRTQGAMIPADGVAIRPQERATGTDECRVRFRVGDPDVSGGG